MEQDQFADRVISRSIALQAPVVAGLDPRPELLTATQERSAEGSADRLARAYVEFGEVVLDGLRDVVPAVKIQVAFYEALGPAGFEAFFQTVGLARERGLLVIGDIKRGDIGTTAQAYADAFVGEQTTARGQDVDAVTLSPYLGSDSLIPFLESCHGHGRGAFALARTSNPSATQIQDLLVDGLPVYRHVARWIEQWGSELIGQEGYSSLGAVVGATYPRELAEIRQAHPNMLLLVPGYGAQGGTAEDVAAALDDRCAGLLVASSRGILKAYRQADETGTNPADGIRRAAEKMRDEIRTAWDRVRTESPPNA